MCNDMAQHTLYSLYLGNDKNGAAIVFFLFYCDAVATIDRQDYN